MISSTLFICFITQTSFFYDVSWSFQFDFITWLVVLSPRILRCGDLITIWSKYLSTKPDFTQTPLFALLTSIISLRVLFIYYINLVYAVYAANWVLMSFLLILYYNSTKVYPFSLSSKSCISSLDIFPLLLHHFSIINQQLLFPLLVLLIEFHTLKFHFLVILPSLSHIWPSMPLNLTKVVHYNCFAIFPCFIVFGLHPCFYHYLSDWVYLSLFGKKIFFQAFIRVN